MEHILLSTSTDHSLVNETLVFLLSQGLMVVAFLALATFYYHNKSVWRSRSQRRKARYLKHLSRWGVTATSEELPSIQEHLRLYWRILVFLSMLGAAVSLLLVLVVAVVVSLLQTGTLHGLDVVDSTLWSAETYFATCLGLGAGYLVGFWWVKRRTLRLRSYGDLQPRRLSNYRSWGFFWLQVLLIGGYVGTTLINLPFLNDPLYLGNLPVHQSIWVLWGLPLIMVLVVLAVELCLSRIVSAPRLLVTAGPALGKRLDDMVRAQTIGLLQWFTLVTIAWLGVAQESLLLSDNTGPHLPWMQLAFVVSGGVLLSSPLLLTLNGRLGGKQTGWPWNPGVAQ